MEEDSNSSPYLRIIAEANELRASAYKLSSSSMHALADAKMRELEQLIRAADADAVERARREGEKRP